MIIRHQKITLIKLRKPAHHTVNEDLQWFGNSLGLFNLRDKEKNCFRIFIELLKSARRNDLISSDDLAYKLGISRGTVIHHINKLMEAGIVVCDRNRYYLRVDRLQQLVQELRKDLMRSLEDLEDIAKEIDGAMGL